MYFFKLTSVVVLIEGPGQDVVGPDTLLDGLHVLWARPVLVDQHVNRSIITSLKAVTPRTLGHGCVFGREILNLE